MLKFSFVYTVFFFLSALSIKGQIDTEFWFAAPEVTTQHADRPIFMRISTFNQAANVKISIPANSAVEAASMSIGANATQSINLTPWINELENTSYNQVTNKGLHITSSAKISVYYEVMGTSFIGAVNPEIFALKGKNGLGTSFFCPFQNKFNNHEYRDLVSHSIDIVASQNNTIITVTPTKNMIGHAANIPFNIYLNRGQTYSMKSSSFEAVNKLSGTEITSNKPIAITLKDDSVQEPNGGWDLVGDQLIPVPLLGTDYVCGQGTVFVLAIENSTVVTFGSSNSVVMQKQETRVFEVQGDQGKMIKASKPVYVFHLKNHNGEMGGAILPPVKCTGSKKVSFTRSTNEAFIITLIVKSGGENHFTFNGDNTQIKPEDFKSVEGSNGRWLIYQKPTILIGANSVGVIENSQMKFHLGMENGNFALFGSRYGYFSDFSDFQLNADKIDACEGQSVVLDAESGYDNYLWSTGSSTKSISVNQSGLYKIEVNDAGGECYGIDSVEVVFHEYPYINTLPENIELCFGESIELNAGPDSIPYSWNTGAVSNVITVASTGQYIATANNVVCQSSSTSFVDVAPEPNVNLGQDTSFCKGYPWKISLNPSFDITSWNTGSSSPNIEISEEGEYAVRIETYAGGRFCGMDEDTINVKFWDIETYNVITPNGDGLNDVFFVGGIETGNWELNVYNRWGSRVYYNKHYTNNWGADDLNNGVYYFELTEDSPCNTYRGWVTVLR